MDEQQPSVEDNIDIDIYSEEDYLDQQMELQETSSNREYNLLPSLDQRQNYVEAKYQKYKQLRKQLQAQRMNLPENKSVQSSYSSFSGSSLSSDSDQQNGGGISKQTFEMVARQFQILQQPRVDTNSQPVTFKKIADEHDLSTDYVQTLFEKWKKDKTLAGKIAKAQYNNSQEKPRERVTLVPTENMLNIERAKAIERLITQNPYLSQNDIFLELNKINNLKSIKYGKYREISRTIVTKLLTEGPFKQKRLRVLHSDRNETHIVNVRQVFCKLLLKKINNKKNVVFFMDEHNFQLFHDCDCIWVRPDQLGKAQSPRKHQFSLLALFDCLGGAYWKISNNCLQKYDDYEGFKSLFDQAAQVLQQHESKEGSEIQKKVAQKPARQMVVVMDSTISSNEQKMKKYQQMLGAKIMGLPPSSQQLNPIEEWFQQLRLRIRQNTYASNEQLLRGVHLLLKQYQTYNYKPLVSQALTQIERGYRKDRF